MLAFDKKLNRIGYGGGYYDATIKFMRKKKSFLAIGLGYDKQEIVNVPILDHDQRMDLIVTEKRIIQKKGLFNR
jgi:5-formyltetrahydrofolate cyclo-ligase